MAVGLEQRGMDNQAIVGDAQTALEAEIGFVFGRAVALGRRGTVQDRGRAEDAPLKATGQFTDRQGHRVNDL